MKTRILYRSSNGDDWQLACDNAGAFHVIHRANLSSGGTQTTFPVKEFLERSGESPEAQAVRAALDAGAQGAIIDVDETSAGGLHFPEGS